MDTAHELPRDPWWEVISVFDDDGRHRFAYTVGLAERGLPEIHLWADPSLGEDPGADWRLGSTDMARILNRTAGRLAEGSVTVGSAWEESYDAGLVTVRFVLDRPVDADEIEAFHASPSTVLPLRWSLHRAVVGPPAPLTAHEQAIAAAEFEAIVQGTVAPVRLEGWTLPARPSWSPLQRWGPLTPLVNARAQALLQAGPQVLITMLNLGLALVHRRMTGYAVVVAAAAGRPAGRTGALERLAADVDALVGDIGSTWGHQAWRAALDWLNEDEDDEIDEGTAKHILGDVVRPFLVTVAAQDLLPRDVLVHGAGPFVSALTPRGTPASDAWQAPGHVVVAVRTLVLAAGPHALARAAKAWSWPVDESGTQARGEVTCLMVTTPAMHPSWRDTLPGEFVRRVPVPEIDTTGSADVQEWLSVLTTALSHRSRLSPDTIDRITTMGGRPFPGLRRLLDEPLVVQ